MSSSTRSLNGLSGNTTTNVYVNTIDVFEGTLPVVVAQTSANQPVNISLKGISSFGGANKILKINSSNNALIWADDTTESITVSLPLERNGDVISLKGLSSMGTAGKIIKVNSGGTALEYADEDGSNWTRTQGGLGTVGYIQPAVSTDRVSIPPNSDIVFDNSPVDTDGFVLAHDTTNNAFTIKEKDGTLLLKLNANNMNVEWGTQGFMDFKGKALHGSNAEYPLGQNIGVGTIGLIFIATAYIKLITTNEILFNNYNASPFSIQSSIRLNDSGELYNTQGKWKGDTFYVDTNVDMLNNSSIMFRETTANGNHRINLIGQSSLSGDFTITLPATNGTVALTSDIPSDFIQSVSSPLAVSSNNLTLGTVPYNKGGTGLTSYTEGDLLYASADNVLAKLPHGSGGDILRMNGTGTLPEWRTMYGATSPIVLTGGTTFELTTVPVNKGGTGFTGCNAGDMIYSLVANTLTKLNIGSTGQVLKVSGGLPVWSNENDTTYTAQTPLTLVGTEFQLGLVPTNKGGTGISAYTAGDILYTPSVGSNDLEKLPIGSTGQVLKVSGGLPVWGTDTDTVYTVNTPITLTNSTEIGLTTVPYNLGGTGLTSYTEGDLLYASADNVLAKLPHGNSGDILRMNGTGTLPEWRTMYGATSPIVLTGGLTFELNTVPVSKGGTGFTGCNAGDMIYSLVANTLTKLNIGSTGQVLKVSGGLPVWSNETDTTYTGTGNIDITGTTISLTGTIPQSNGGTGFNTYTVGDILYCDTTNTLSKLPIGTTGQVLKVDSGKPSWGALSGATPFTTSGNLLYPTDTNLRLLVGATANSNDYKLRVNGDAYINGPTYIEQSTHFGIRLIRSGFNGICWYASEADAQGDTNRKAYIQADTGSNGKMFFNCLSQQFIFGTSSSIGRIGVNKSNPQFPLDVDHTLNDTSASVNYRYITTLSAGGPVQVYNTTAKFDGRIWITDVIYNSSDRRIKENINELNSSKSLEIIDKLKVCEYTMKDIKRNGNAKHLGFIAQEVEAEYPLAVNDSNEYIPDIYKNVDCVYTKVGEEYKVKISELGEVSGVEYSFYVWVGEEDRNEISLELVGNEDNTFTFEKEYENVFCYGKKVSDFKTLEKETLYDLNVSATQELHNKIKTLETELTTYKSIVDKLINSKSFAEFKKSL